MKKEPMQSLLDTWYRERDEAPRDADSDVSQVMSRVPQTRQRSRWWRFPIPDRRTQTPTATATATDTDTAEYQPSPIPATNGHTPTVIGRTSSMLSPVKAISAGALTFAIVGAFLVAQPFQQQGSVPGAEAEVPAPVAFTARYSWSHQPATGEVEILPNGIERTRDAAWLFRSTSASDARFEGVSTLNSTWDWYPEAEEIGVSLNAHVVRYENDEGVWQSAPFTRFEWNARDTPGDVLMQTGESTQYTLYGEDAYEGFTALVVETWNGNGWDLEGYIFDGDLPPAPEAWSEVSDSQ